MRAPALSCSYSLPPSLLDHTRPDLTLPYPTLPTSTLPYYGITLYHQCNFESGKKLFDTDAQLKKRKMKDQKNNNNKQAGVIIKR
jgi:hypothetical protein